MAIRLLFDHQAARAMESLEPRLPDGIDRLRHLTYGTDRREKLDLFLPSGPAPPGGWPVIVWVHGGAFVTSAAATTTAAARPRTGPNAPARPCSAISRSTTARAPRRARR